MKNTKELIIKALRLGPADHSTMLFYGADMWLDKLSDSRVIARVAELPLFWKWWKNQWDIRDQEFIRLTNLNEINQPLSGDTLHMAQSLYNDIHDATGLKIIPNAWLNKQIAEIVASEIEQTEAYINTQISSL